MFRKQSDNWTKHFDFIIFDLISLHLAFLIAYFLRYGTFSVNPYNDEYWAGFMLISEMIDLFAAAAFNTFHNVLRRAASKELGASVLQALAVIVLTTFAMYSLHIGEVYSRIVTYLTGAIYAVMTFAVRVIWKHYLRSRYTDAGKRHMLIIALEKNAEKIADSIIFQDRDRYVISGIAVENARQSGPAIGNYRVVADKTDVIEYLKRNWVDDVFLDPELETEQDYSKLRADLVEMGIVTHAPIKEYSDMSGRQQAVQTIGGSRVVTTGLKSVPAWQLFIKRLSDILGGLIGTAVTLVLTVFIAPVIWMTDPGPVFFTQTRVGENGKRFKMIKFRSMYKDAERHKAELQTGENSDGLLFKMEADPRIIGCKVNEDGSLKKGFGNFLRDSSLDEFPQFINVLLGQMSMVGTRPPTVDEWENYDLHHRARLSVRPGITGLWQVSGSSNIKDFERIVELDTEYINNWSVWLDIKILLKTVAVVFKREGAM